MANISQNTLRTRSSQATSISAALLELITITSQCLKIFLLVFPEDTARVVGKRLQNLVRGSFLPSGAIKLDSLALGALMNLTDDAIKNMANRNGIKPMAPGGTFLFSPQDFFCGQVSPKNLKDKSQ